MNFDKQTLKQLEALGYVELEKDKSNNGNGAANKNGVSSIHDSNVRAKTKPDKTNLDKC